MPEPVEYPTPWTATWHTMISGRWYAGVIERKRDKYRRESVRCAHRHGRPDLAQRCADRMLAVILEPGLDR